MHFIGQEKDKFEQNLTETLDGLQGALSEHIGEYKGHITGFLDSSKESGCLRIKVKPKSPDSSKRRAPKRWKRCLPQNTIAPLPPILYFP